MITSSVKINKRDYIILNQANISKTIALYQILFVIPLDLGSLDGHADIKDMMVFRMFSGRV